MLAGVALAIACGVYLSADILYGRGLDAFAAGDIPSAHELHAQAIRSNPRVDVYRVALSDDAAYLGASQTRAALDSLEAGLSMEPQSYDLALARARSLAMLDADIQAQADAYELAAGLYPLGVAVRREAVPVLLEAGRTSEARSMVSDVLRVVPDDILGSTADEGSAP
jgi:tetratricopeptide (TPR) repeat protein